MAHRASLLAGLCLMALTSVLYAQAPAEKKEITPPKSARSKTVKAEEADPVAAQRQVVAISLLQSLADDARSFREPKLRARVQARVADVLWETDSERARGLFRKAWEAAETEDAESDRRGAEESARPPGTGARLRTARPDLRAEVLRLAAKRDRALGEEFLARLAEANKKEAETASDKARQNNSANDFSASPAAAKRLALARRLLEDGDVERALEFAGPVLDQVNMDSITFLSALREKNAAAADQGFASLLARTERDPGSDANTVSGLSSYAFTPFLYVTFDAGGGANQNRQRPPAPRPDLPPALRATFFRVASQVLLRPLAPPDQDPTSSGRVGKYMVIRRLLPLFEEYAPERAADLRTQMAAMAADVSDDMRGGENRAVTNGITPPSSGDPVDTMQGRLDRARTSAERDAIYADLAVALAGRGDPRARDLVDKIEESELRKHVRSYIDFQTAQSAINDKNALEAARIAKTGELTSLQRVWAFTQAARLLMTSDRSRALELLEEAGTEARRIGSSDPDRARALVAVATGLTQADRVRAWETISEAVKAANSADGFTGDDSRVGAQLRTESMVLATSATAEDFNLLGAFRALARDDFLRSVETAKSFTGEAPRATATLAVARSVLEKTPTAVQLPRGQ
ncbi:MAG: hypothetical protein ND895_09725 [Pyrinomonadaceae bacterium]|nr:hypothetical protein [Pyrinomonadaceae bacterium]